MKAAFAFVSYPVADIERAIEFYRDFIGLRVGQDFGEMVEFDLDGVAFAIDSSPLIANVGPQTSAGFEVDDVALERERLLARGVTVSDVYDFAPCRICVVTDPDGNRFALHTRKSR